MFLFADVETTGLDPYDDKIIEVGMMVVNEDLEVVDQISHVVYLPGMFGDDPPFGIHGVVVEMHTKNGLWKECRDSKLTIRDVDNKLFDWIKERGYGNLPLTGNTISFDRQFICGHLPRTNGAVDYHNIDISSVKALATKWRPDLVGYPVERKTHRVEVCLEDSLLRLQFLKEFLF